MRGLQDAFVNYAARFSGEELYNAWEAVAMFWEAIMSTAYSTVGPEQAASCRAPLLPVGNHLPPHPRPCWTQVEAQPSAKYPEVTAWLPQLFDLALEWDNLCLESQLLESRLTIVGAMLPCLNQFVSRGMGEEVGKTSRYPSLDGLFRYRCCSRTCFRAPLKCSSWPWSTWRRRITSG
jgi:hypothetical protein